MNLKTIFCILPFKIVEIFGNSKLLHIKILNSFVIPFRKDLVKYILEIENGKWKTQLLKDGNDCLHIAFEKGDADIVTLLMDWSPLYVAVQKRDKKCVEEILRNSEEKEKVLEQEYVEADTTLQLAIKRKEDKIVQQLLEAYGQTVNLSDEKRKDLLSLSARFENSNVFKYSLNASDENRNTPLHVIAEFGREEWLATYCDKDRYGDLINVNTKDEDENTPLHLATKNDHLGTVKLLLNMGGDVQIKDGKGRNSIQIAIESGVNGLYSHSFRLTKGGYLNTAINIPAT